MIKKDAEKAFYVITNSGGLIEYDKFEQCILIPNINVILIRELIKTYGPDSWGNRFYDYDYISVDSNGNPKLLKIGEITCVKITGNDDTRTTKVSGNPFIRAEIIDSNGDLRTQLYYAYNPKLENLIDDLKILDMLKFWHVYDTKNELEKCKKEIELLRKENNELKEKLKQ